MSLERLRRGFTKRPALITYVMGGDGDSVQQVVDCVESGASIVELGFPFSDPIADGRVIQAAATRSLTRGTTLAKVLELARKARARVESPLVLMGYLNPVLSFGYENFAKACAEAGVDAVILPDLPPEEASEWCAAAARHDVGTVFLLAPTSTPEREAAVLAASTGFVYFVSVTGVTGTRSEIPDIRAHVERVRAEAVVPVVIGFGISTPEHARAMGAFSDGVVVGSAIVERNARGEPLRPFVTSLHTALNSKEP